MTNHINVKYLNPKSIIILVNDSDSLFVDEFSAFILDDPSPASYQQLP
jgi:hypothetical protein